MTQLILDYGLYLLFLLVAVESMGVPLPGETALIMVIFVAGLQSIPDEILEAAAVDGAGPVRRFWHVTRPMLAPALTVNLMLSIIGGLKLFDQVWVLTNGGPGTSTETLSTLIYKNAFQFGEFAYSTALALLLALFVAVISGAQYHVLRRQETIA